MTRVNLVDPVLLADQHLFAEWREIKMVPAALRRSLRTRNKNDILRNISNEYTLNKGHVTFFYDKMNFLSDRYSMLTDELVKRGYELQTHDVSDIFYNNIPEEFKTIEWSPTKYEIKINVERILLRLSERPNWYRYTGKLETYQWFKNILTRE